MGRFLVKVLGAFVASRDDVTVAVPETSKRLVAFLAVSPGPWRRSYIAGQLWPELPEARALGSLRNTVWRLGDDMQPLVRRENDQLGLSNDVSTDLDEARRLAEGLFRGDPGVVDVAARRVTLLSGQLLPDWYEDWLLFEQARLKQLSLHALERLARALAEQARWGEALDAALRAVALEPLRETAHRTVFDIHVGEGNFTEASRQYEEYRVLLHEELHASPSPPFTAAAAPFVRSAKRRSRSGYVKPSPVLRSV